MLSITSAKILNWVQAVILPSKSSANLYFYVPLNPSGVAPILVSPMVLNSSSRPFVTKRVFGYMSFAEVSNNLKHLLFDLQQRAQSALVAAVNDKLSEIKVRYQNILNQLDSIKQILLAGSKTDRVSKAD